MRKTSLKMVQGPAMSKRWKDDRVHRPGGALIANDYRLSPMEPGLASLGLDPAD